MDTTSLCSYGEIPILLDPGIVLHLADVTGPDDPAILTSLYATTHIDANIIVDDDRVLAGGSAGSRIAEASLEAIYCINTVPNGGYDRDTLAAPSESCYSLSPYAVSPSTYGEYDIDSSVFPASLTVSSVTTPTWSTGVSPTGSPSLGSFNVLPPYSVACRQVLEGELIRSPSLYDQPRDVLPRSYSTTSTGALPMSPSPSGIIDDALAPHTSHAENSLQIRRRQKSRSCYPLVLPDISISPLSPGTVLRPKAPSSEPTTPLLPAYNPPPGLRQHRRTDSSATSASNRSLRSVRSGQISSPLASPVAKRRLTRNLPGVLDWLEDTRIELWIDQEGSHAVRQTFKLVGFTTGQSEDQDTTLVNALTYGLAEFMPMMRRSFIFDAGKADLPPTLRRVTILEDDSKDYISSQATLATSSDGAYTVNGTEYFDLQRHQAPLVLRWRFEYGVDAGPRETERTLTPLRFSCSPGLLHPSHGRKQTKLLQFFKRSSSMRLFAEKIEVPRQSYAGTSFQDRRDSGDRKDGSGKENHYGRGLGLVGGEYGPSASELPADSQCHGSVRRQPSMKLKRSPRLTSTMLKPTTPMELMSLHAEYLRTRGHGL
ncbi:hypothetical protein EVJ58_g2718 [Rhodofomes roseus]|uniref:Uncharacterized protein n=1 Tax=Rhodofomes roseus TaxID=34475 RepID=A0A4Y9YR98_9APHY|nr:hypothetical protein EVJ58_g2718 [Rhodofomes roseus]